MDKICTVCKIKKPFKDFIGTQVDCYKCVYAKKLKSPIKLIRTKECGICHHPLPKQRWTYCSPLCAKEGKKRNRYWTLAMKTDTKDWKKRFVF